MGVKASDEERPLVAPLLPNAFFANFLAVFALSFCFCCCPCSAHATARESYSIPQRAEMQQAKACLSCMCWPTQEDTH